MKRISCLVSDEAKDVLLRHKLKKHYVRQDDALQDLLMHFEEAQL